MKLWPFACLIASFTAAWAPTIHAQGAFEDCCLGYHPNPKWQILRRASHYWNQEVSGSCNLRAKIFYFSMKKIWCGNPQNKEVQMAMGLLEARKKGSPAPQAERKKQNHGRSKVKYRSIHLRNATTHHSRSGFLMAQLQVAEAVQVTQVEEALFVAMGDDIVNPVF